MSETKSSLPKEAFKNYKKYFGFKSALVSLFGLIIFICLILAYLSPITLLLSTPFVIFPFLLSFLALNSSSGAHGETPGMLFKMFPLYYSRTFFGSFKFWFSFLKVAVSFIVVELTLTTVLYFTYASKDTTFMNLINDITNAANTRVLIEKIEELQQNPTFLLVNTISSVSASGVSSLLFINHIFKNSVPVFYNFFNKHPIPMRSVHTVHKVSLKKMRGKFYKEYFSSLWFIFLLYILGFVGATLLGMLVINLNGPSLGIVSIFGGVLLILFFLPYTFDVLAMIAQRHVGDYMKAFIDISKKDLESVKGDQQYTPEQIEKMKQLLDEMSKAFEKNKEPNKDNSEDKK